MHFKFKANEYKFAGSIKIIMPQSKGIFEKINIKFRLFKGGFESLYTVQILHILTKCPLITQFADSSIKKENTIKMNLLTDLVKIHFIYYFFIKISLRAIVTITIAQSKCQLNAEL